MVHLDVDICQIFYKTLSVAITIFSLLTLIAFFKVLNLNINNIL